MQNLLQELYKIEPDLRAQEANLEKIITQMLLTKPEITISENFKKVLKNRLDSEIALQRANWIHTKNKYFRIFWYIAGGAALASFAVSFWFLSIFKTTPVWDIKPSIKSNIHSPEIAQNNTVSTGTSETWPVAMNRVMPESASADIHTWITGSVSTKKPPTTTENSIPPWKPLASVAVTDTLSESAPVAMSLMSTNVNETTTVTGEITPTSSGQVAMIAYVGEDLNTPPSWVKSRKGFAAGMASTAPMGWAAADSSVSSSDSFTSSVSTGSESSTGSSASTATWMTFSEVVSRAQTEADKLIPESERWDYVLTTPIITYISRNSKTSKDTVELVPVYVFSIVRTDGKESKIKEVQVSLP